MKSPPSMYFNQPGQRRMLSPPTSRSPAISPRASAEGLPRSPPTGFQHEIIPGKPYMPYPAESRDKYAYQTNGPPDHVRMNEQMRKQQELHVRASSDQTRGQPSDARKTVLSPRDGRDGSLGLPASFGGRSIHDFVDKDYPASFSRHQSPRGDIPPPRDIPPRSSLYEQHRHEDGEQSRLMSSSYLMPPGLSSQQSHYSSTPPAGAPPPVSAHSSNLALGRADGSILSKLHSNYANEQKR